MAAAIVPAIQLGISAYSAWKRNKEQKKAQEQMQAQEAEAKQAREAITAQAPGFQQRDRQLTQIGIPLLQTTGNYYRNLIGGDRGAIDSALAPDRAAISETYAGAAKGLDRMRGPSRDLATAELARSRAGAMGLLPAQARANAVQQGQAAGEYATSTGLDSASRGASLYESAAGLAGGAAARGINQGYLSLAQNQQNQASGSGMGTLIGQIITGYLGSRGGGGGTLGTTGWTPPMSPYPASIYGRG